MGRIVIYIFILTSSLLFAGEKERGFIKPSLDFKYTRIRGKDYIKGEVYVSKKVLPDFLKDFGFRDIEFYASASQYNRYKALWPRELELDSLPPEVYGTNLDEQSCLSDKISFYCPIDNKTTTIPRYGYTSVSSGKVEQNEKNMFTQAFPSQPDTTVNGLPYVKGRVYLHNAADTSVLKTIGFVSFNDTGLDEILNPDISLEKYINDPEKYKERIHKISALEYRTTWPFKLNDLDIPSKVIGLISDLKAKEMGGSPTTITIKTVGPVEIVYPKSGNDAYNCNTNTVQCPK